MRASLPAVVPGRLNYLVTASSGRPDEGRLEVPVVAVLKKKEGMPMLEGSTKRTLTILGTD